MTIIVIGLAYLVQRFFSGLLAAIGTAPLAPSTSSTAAAPITTAASMAGLHIHMIHSMQMIFMEIVYLQTSANIWASRFVPRRINSIGLIIQLLLRGVLRRATYSLMTACQIFEQESGNADKIILHREAIFWKAYERSAYLLCSSFHGLKVSCRPIKSAGGRVLRSVGFPDCSLTKYASGLELISSEENLLVYRSPSQIDDDAFSGWKTSGTISIEDAIRDFSLENHTPLECMDFLKKIKDGLI